MTGSKHARYKMRPVGVVLLLLGGGLSGYWAWTYTGVYRWLAELQLRFVHEYEVQITFILTLAIVLGPLFFVAAVIRRFTSTGASQGTGAADGSDESKAPLGRLTVALTAGGTIGLVGLGFAAVGGYQYRQGMTAGKIVHVDVSAYESGHAPGGLYVSISGQSLHDATEVIKDSDSATKYFMPLVSADWDPSKPVGLFLETTSPNMMDSNAAQRAQPDGKTLPEVWEGMIDTDGLPGLIRTRFENDHAAFARGYCVLAVGDTPQKHMNDALIQLYIGAGLLVAGVIAGFLTSWKQRNKLRPAPNTATQQREDPRLQIKSVIDFKRKD